MPSIEFRVHAWTVGFRWVLAIEHTEMVLSAALFESLVGYTAARLRDGTYFIEVKPTNDDPAPTEDQAFWDTVRSQTLDLVRRKPRGSEISQILLFGTSSHDPQLHKILNEVIGNLGALSGATASRAKSKSQHRPWRIDSSRLSAAEQDGREHRPHFCSCKGGSSIQSALCT